MSDRVAGILLHPTSLPGPWGVGDLGPTAVGFLDWAQSAGVRLWQVLPLNPSAAANSPYSTLSAFALDPWLISLERLVDDGLLDVTDLPQPMSQVGKSDFDATKKLKAPLFRKAWEQFRDHPSAELGDALAAFCGQPLQKVWLDEWCLFSALRRRRDNTGWWTWEVPLRDRRAEALAAARQELSDDIEFERFLQFCARRQWRQVQAAAKQRGIAILGDLPIYVAHDSAEVWARPHLFELDDRGQPIAVSGVPPDYYAEDGQLWGNPLYRWSTMAEDGYRWWVDRLRGNLELADLVRLDHFRAFADFWRIPGDAETAREGIWQDGPGKALFDAFAEQIVTPLPLIAEDLGDLSDAVHTLRQAVELPGMKVMHFGFDTPDSDHAPFRLSHQTLFYTGTHDNDTSVGWFRSLDEDVRAKIRVFLGSDDDTTIHRHVVRAALTSVARWVVVPMQDILGLDSKARMNTPGVAEGNWGWRLPQLPGADDAAWLRALIEVSGRLV